MNNIIKNTLQEKALDLNRQLAELKQKRNELVTARVREVFNIPPDQGYEIYTRPDAINIHRGGNEILSIYYRSFEGGYCLSTYTTSISTQFEYERLVFVGKVAEKILQSPDVYQDIFAPTEVDEEIDSLHTSYWEVERELTKVRQEEEKEKKATAVKNFLAGEEIVFQEPEKVVYGSRRYDYVWQVVKMRCVEKSKSGKKVDVEFTVLSDWETGTFKTRLIPDIKLANLERYL